MWAIKDDDAPIVAEAFYSYLWKDVEPDSKIAAFALHSAVQRLREISGSFIERVQFIHMGFNHSFVILPDMFSLFMSLTFLPEKK